MSLSAQTYESLKKYSFEQTKDIERKLSTEGQAYTDALWEVTALTILKLEEDLWEVEEGVMTKPMQELRELYSELWLPRIIVIGAGPKALTDLALTSVLREAWYFAPLILVLEKTWVWAHRTGQGWYSSLKQDQSDRPLNISALKDVVHGECSFGVEIQTKMMKYGRLTYEYAQWTAANFVNTYYDDAHNTHASFAKYLQRVASHFPHQILLWTVQWLIPSQDCTWQVHYTHGEQERHLSCEAVVKTWAWNAYVPEQIESEVKKKVRDSKNMYQHAHQANDLSEKSILVIGGWVAWEDALEFFLPLSKRVDVFSRKPLKMVTDERLYNAWSFSTSDVWQSYTYEQKKRVESHTDTSCFSEKWFHLLRDNQAKASSLVWSLQTVSFEHNRFYVTWTDALWEQQAVYDHVIVCCGLRQGCQLQKLLWDELLASFGVDMKTIDSRLDEHLPQDQAMKADWLPNLILPMHSMKRGLWKPWLWNLLGSSCDRMSPYVIDLSSS